MPSTTSLTAHLSSREKQLLHLLGRGFTYLQIQERLHLSQANVHTTAHHLRQKTGILDTRNPEEVRAFQRGRMGAMHEAQAFAKPVYPTPRQLDVMRLIAQGLGYDAIATRLGMGLQTVQNAACQGSRRADLPRSHGLSREHAIRKYLARLDAERLSAGRDANGNGHGAPDPLDQF